jgi:hypothetical protein
MTVPQTEQIDFDYETMTALEHLPNTNEVYVLAPLVFVENLFVVPDRSGNASLRECG